MTPKILVPLLKTQDIKTKLIPFIKTQQLILQNDWYFSCELWQDALVNIADHSFTYLDLPYINRNADYPELHYALSMWYQNKYRKNKYVKQWNDKMITNEHFYFVGAQEKNVMQ